MQVVLRNVFAHDLHAQEMFLFRKIGAAAIAIELAEIDSYHKILRFWCPI